MAGKRTTRTTEINKNSEALNKFTTAKPITNSLISDLNILYTNADCFNNKKNDLELLLNSLNSKPDLIIITEINPKKMVKGLQESEFNINGYNMFALNIGVEKCRGIIIYVKSYLCAVEIEVNHSFSECLFIQFRGVLDNVLTIGAFYRSPTGNVINDKKLIDLIENISSVFSGKLILLGDFNFSSIDWSNWSTSCGVNSIDSKFLNCLRNNFLIQHVSFPTRARGSDKPHTLDLIISNGDFISNVTNFSPLGKSDHSVLLCNCKIETEMQNRLAKFSYGKGDYNGLRTHVDNVIKNSDVIKPDVDRTWLNLKSVILEACEKCIPVTTGDQWKKRVHGKILCHVKPEI